MLYFRVKLYDFALPERYAAGPYELSPGEAQALNQFWLENIRKNCDGAVFRAADAAAAEGRVLTQQEQQELQDHIAAYAEGYKFSERPRPRVPGPVEMALRARAFSVLQIELGLSADEEIPEEALAEAMARPEVQAEARAAIARQLAVAQQELDALGL